MRKVEHKGIIEGILSEIDIKEVSYEKNGVPMEALSGVVKVRVNLDNETLEIPVNVFANKITNAGKEHPGYKSLQTLKDNFVSIAAGGEENADAIRVTGINLVMNEYYDQNGNLISYPRVRASFFNKVKKDELAPKAEFDLEMMIASVNDDLDKEGVPTGRLKIMGIVPQYNGVDVMPFYAINDKAVSFIKNYWKEGDTVKMHGKIHFTSKHEIIKEDVAFGDPIERTRTITTSELIGTAGTNALEGDFAFDRAEIDKLLAERKARLEAEKEKSMSRTKQASAPAPSGSFGDNLGF